MRTVWWARRLRVQTVKGFVGFSAAVGVSLLVACPGGVQAVYGRTMAQATASKTTEPRPILTQGDTGSIVEQLQADLARQGLYDGVIDGIYGPSTVLAVKTFQQQQNLAADGVVGVETWQALQLGQSRQITLAVTPGLKPELLTSMFTPLTFSQPEPPPSPLWLVLMPLVPLVGGGLTYVWHRLRDQQTTTLP